MTLHFGAEIYYTRHFWKLEKLGLFQRFAESQLAFPWSSLVWNALQARFIKLPCGLALRVPGSRSYWTVPLRALEKNARNLILNGMLYPDHVVRGPRWSRLVIATVHETSCPIFGKGFGPFLLRAICTMKAHQRLHTWKVPPVENVTEVIELSRPWWKSNGITDNEIWFNNGSITALKRRKWIWKPREQRDWIGCGLSFKTLHVVNFSILITASLAFCDWCPRVQRICRRRKFNKVPVVSYISRQN